MELVIIGLICSIMGGLLILAAQIGKIHSKIDKILNNTISKK